jgi:hypothetical protein
MFHRRNVETAGCLSQALRTGGLPKFLINLEDARYTAAWLDTLLGAYP